MHNRSQDHCSPNVPLRQSRKGSPHSHGILAVDVVPSSERIPSTLNPLPRYYREFQSRSRGNTVNTATVSLFYSRYLVLI